MGFFGKSGDNENLVGDRTTPTQGTKPTEQQSRDAALESRHGWTDEQILDGLDSNGTGH